jgi:flagellar basal-body rod protein FlgB
MYLDRLLNQDSMPVLDTLAQFTEARQSVLGEDIANVSTPNFVQKDLSIDEFQEILKNRVAEAGAAAPGSVRFDDISIDIQNPHNGILFHDGNNRSMEQLMSDQAKNALMHNLAVELLRNQYSQLETAIKEGK